MKKAVFALMDDIRALKAELSEFKAPPKWPTCPLCGWKLSNAMAGFVCADDGGDHEYVCENCGELFIMNVGVFIKITTRQAS